jgi:hypothetical protein
MTCFITADAKPGGLNSQIKITEGACNFTAAFKCIEAFFSGSLFKISRCPEQHFVMTRGLRQNAVRHSKTDGQKQDKEPREPEYRMREQEMGHCKAADRSECEHLTAPAPP